MKKSGEVHKHTKGQSSAKYDSRSAEFKQEQEQKKAKVVAKHEF